MKEIPKIPNKIIQHDLKTLVENGKITINTLSKVTRIEKQWFEDYISEKEHIESISPDEIHFITDFISILSLGMKIDDDSRLKAIIEVLTQIYEMNTDTIANCIEIDRQIIENFMLDSNLISMEEKYTLSVKVMFLYYILKFPKYDILN